MKVILEWNGEREDLLKEQDGMSLADNIVWLLDYGSGEQGITHNNIHITKGE